MISLTDLIKKVFYSYVNNFWTILPLLLAALAWNIAIAVIPVSVATTIKFMIPTAIISLVISAFTELCLIGGFSALFQNTEIAPRIIIATALVKLPWFILILILWLTSILVGMIFLIVPAIIFATWFMFVGVILMLENEKIPGVFRRSKYLVSGNFFALLLRAAAIMILIFLIVSMANQGFAGIIDAISSVSNISRLSMVSNIFGAILSVLFLPVITGTIVALYYEMKRLKGA